MNRNMLGLLAGAALILLGGCGGSTDDDGTSNQGGAGSGGTTGGSGGTTGGSGGTTGGAGGACTVCGPDGAACCNPGTGCAVPNGGPSCNCGVDGLWSCGSNTGGAGGSAGTCGRGIDCGGGFTCCNGLCVNPANDIYNCGACGNACPGPNPFCTGNGCGQAPCSVTPPPPPGEACCGSNVCTAGELCCMVNLGPGILDCFPPENGTCPKGCPECVCASPDTPIATPSGPQPIASLRSGDLVYSLHRGNVVAVPLRRTQRVEAFDHHVVEVELDNGVTLRISAPHPTADGRTFGDLRAGGSLGGIRIQRVELVPYTHAATYDILPESDSATYFAAGVLIGSTLAPGAVEPLCVNQ